MERGLRVEADASIDLAAIDITEIHTQDCQSLTINCGTLTCISQAYRSKALEEDLANRVQHWRGLLTRQVPQARQILRKLLPSPL